MAMVRIILCSRDAFASQRNWLSINTTPEVSSPLTLQLHYFLFPGLAIKNYKKRNKNRTESQGNILVWYFQEKKVDSFLLVAEIVTILLVYKGWIFLKAENVSRLLY